MCGQRLFRVECVLSLSASRMVGVASAVLWRASTREGRMASRLDPDFRIFLNIRIFSAGFAGEGMSLEPLASPFRFALCETSRVILVVHGVSLARLRDFERFTKRSERGAGSRLVVHIQVVQTCSRNRSSPTRMILFRPTVVTRKGHHICIFTVCWWLGTARLKLTFGEARAMQRRVFPRH